MEELNGRSGEWPGMPRVSDLRRGKIHLFPIGKLAFLLAAEGLRVDPRVKKAARAARAKTLTCSLSDALACSQDRVHCKQLIDDKVYEILNELARYRNGQ